MAIGTGPVFDLLVVGARRQIVGLMAAEAQVRRRRRKHSFVRRRVRMMAEQARFNVHRSVDISGIARHALMTTLTEPAFGRPQQSAVLRIVTCSATVGLVRLMGEQSCASPPRLRGGDDLAFGFFSVLLAFRGLGHRRRYAVKEETQELVLRSTRARPHQASRQTQGQDMADQSAMLQTALSRSSPSQPSPPPFACGGGRVAPVSAGSGPVTGPMPVPGSAEGRGAICSSENR